MNRKQENPLQSKVDELEKSIEQLQEDLNFSQMMSDEMGKVLEALLVVPPENMQPEGVLSWLQSLHSELTGGATLEDAIHSVNVSLGIKAVNYVALQRVAKAMKSHAAAQKNRPAVRTIRH